MAGGTIGCQTQGIVVRVARLIKLLDMTGRAFGRGAGITVGVTFDAIGGQVSPGQREGREAVIEAVVGTAVRMAGQAGRAVVDIAVDPFVVVIGFRIDVAGDAGKLRETRTVRVTVDAFHPFALVRAAIDREIVAIML